MKLLINQNDLKNYKYTDKLPLECIRCGITHYRTKSDVCRILYGKFQNTKKCCFCSHICADTYLRKKIKTNCGQCNKEIMIYEKLIKGSKSGKNFCSNKCAGKYTYNTRIRTNCKRSKLEKWLEIKLKELYPALLINYNDKLIIGSELDIYVPSLNLAFELNGIFHYEPIFGNPQLDKIQNNDRRKFQICHEKGISFCVIDTSKQKYFKEKYCMPYLDIIRNIIDEKISQSSR